MLITSELIIIYDNSRAVQKQRNKMVRNDDGGEGAELDVDEDGCDGRIILMTVGVESWINMLVNSYLLILLVTDEVADVISFLLVFLQWSGNLM